MKASRLFLIIVLITVSSSLLFGYTIGLPEEAPVNKSLDVLLMQEDGDAAVESARFYLMQEGADPLFLDLEQTDGTWSGTIPGIYITGEALQYFTEVKGTDGYIRRIPDKGSAMLPLTADTAPPELTLLAPEELILQIGQPQVIMLTAEGEASLTVNEFSINGQPIEGVVSFGPFIQGIYTPQTNETATLSLSVADASGNESSEELSFQVIGKQRGPFFKAEGDYYADAEITYEVTGSEASLTMPAMDDLFAGLTHEVEVDFGLGASGMVGAGPIELAVSVDLGDTRDLMEYIDTTYTDNYANWYDYPYLSATMSDYYEVLRLWNPYAYNYTDDMWTHARTFDSNNQFLVDFSIFDEVLVYRFGDQMVSFQDQTVQNMPLRGSFFQLDIPLISVRAANGLIDLGLTEAAWPRQFAGVQVGVDIFDFWYFQTNVSLIADYQGSYGVIKGQAKADNEIAALYGLIDGTDYIVDPEQNLVLGLGTGFNTPWFELKGEAGLTLHVSDAGDVADIVSLAGDFMDDTSALDPIDTYINMIQGYFPVLDYFPISMGIATDALDLSLWGITYGADLTITPLGLSGWYRKTDGSYKSLGASITTGMQQVGGLWDISLGDWGIELGYNWDTANIPDILLNDLVPLVESLVPGVIPTMVTDILDGLATTSIIPEITHEGALTINTPSFGLLGRFKLGGTFAWEYTDTAIEPPDYQDAFIIGGTGSWKSKTLKLGKFSFGLSAKTDDSYVMNRYVDGVEDTSTYWDFSAEGAAKIGYDKVGLAGGYSRDWGTDASIDTVQEIKATLSFKDLWFDTISIGGGWEETYPFGSTSMEELSIDGTLKLKKSIGAFTSGIEITGGYIDNTVDDADDEISWGAKVWGGISL